MSESSDANEVLTYVSNRWWWTPMLLVLIAAPAYVHSGHFQWWWPIPPVSALLIGSVFYVLYHPALSLSAETISERRGPIYVAVDLTKLQSIRASTVSRQTNVMDPNTGAVRSAVRWYRTSSDDWAGRPPVRSVVIEDQVGRRISLGVEGTQATLWASFLLRAIAEQPDIELGPRVSDVLTLLAR